MSWNDYLQSTAKSQPRKLLVEALAFVRRRGKALDLGCGACNDARFLQQSGFAVTAVDSNAEVEQYTEVLNFVASSFQDFEYDQERYALVNAQYALPFNPPETFPNVFRRITDSLKPGGIFVGQFFGPDDEWAGDPKMNFHSRVETERLLEPYEILALREENKIGPLAAGGQKHWHIFHIIARKK